MDEPTADNADEAVREFEPITSQEALDRLIGQRIDRVKKQYSGFDEFKAKAAKFDEFQEASKTELQKVQERAALLETELASERQNALRAAIAAEKGVPPSALTGVSREELEASADALLEWRGPLDKPKDKPKPARGLKSGVTGVDQATDPKERAAAALRAFRHQP